MKALIVDDERLARQELKLLLAAFPQVSIVGEADTVEASIRLAQSTRPDVIFLDVQLRGGVAFEVLEGLHEPKPLIIFCTAYEEHAAKAFDAQAVDYLLKPVIPDRLGRTIAKLETVLDPDPRTPEPASPVPLDKDSFVLLRDGDRHDLVPVRDIIFIESEGNYCRVHLAQATPSSHLLYYSLQSLQQRLPATIFFRASRSQIVNVAHIRSIEPWFSQSLKARLTGEQEIEFSRRAAQTFRERFSL
jgi:two-component system, LytTR family, response regulator